MIEAVRGVPADSTSDSPNAPDAAGRGSHALIETPRRRSRTALGIAVAAAVSFAGLCFAASFSSTLNSDGAGFALAGWDILHGNVLLKHWYMADAPFYALETPLYAVVEAVLGLGATAARVVATLTYLAVALIAAGLAVHGTSGARAARRSAIVALSLSAPLCFGGLSFLVLEMPTHLGTAAYLLLAFLVYARWHDRLLGAVAVLAALTAGQFEDATVLYIGVTAIVLIAASQAVPNRLLIRSEARIAAAALLSYPCAVLVRHIMLHFGAYALVPPEVRLAPLSALPGNLRGTVKSLLFLYNVYQVDMPGPHSAQQYVAAVVGAVAIAAGLFGFVRVLTRWRTADRVDRLTCIAVPLYLGAFAFSTLAADTSSRGYEFIGVIPLFAVLAARNLPEAVRAPGRAATFAVAAACAAVLATGALAPRTEAPWAPPAQLAGWLESHGLTQGIGGYWDAAAVTVDSGGRVEVRAVIHVGRGYQIYRWHTNTAWYNPKTADANFFIANPGMAGMTATDAEAAYGAPSEQYSVGGLDILVYRTNLYKTVR